MQPYRQEVQEFIRMTTNFLAFDTQLSAEERRVILWCLEGLTRQLSSPDMVKPDYGHATLVESLRPGRSQSL